MRSAPDMTDKYEADELRRLNAEPWMVELLSLNPSYTCWGPGEDAMATTGDGWGSSLELARVSEMWELDELNECVNFYFSIQRDSKKCETCGGSGYHRDALWISESFYGHSSPFTEMTFGEARASAVMEQFSGPRSEPLGRGGFPSEEVLRKYGPAFREFCEEMRRYRAWNNRITQDELDALVEEGRCSKWDETRRRWVKDPDLTVERVNRAQDERGGFGLSHDAINRGILIEQRCKRLGVPKTCERCEGHGYIYTAPAAHVELTLWMLHPRKGCSRGVRIKLVKRSELPKVFTWLRGADTRNRERFGKIPKKT
jgi:hypothetical protein